MDILAKIGFDWQVALANFVNFLIIFYLLKRFLFGPVAKILAERKKAIAEGLQNAVLASDALDEAKKEGDRIVAEARAHANSIISAGEKEGLSVRARRVQEAENEAAAILTEAQDRIANERSRLESEIKDKAVAVSILGATTILKEEIDVVKNTKLVKEAFSAV
jgi:F-type H+-transporting ATPase subunit b